MNNPNYTKTAISANIEMALFNTNGTSRNSGLKPILFSKITTSGGKNIWALIHQN